MYGSIPTEAKIMEHSKDSKKIKEAKKKWAKIKLRPVEIDSRTTIFVRNYVTDKQAIERYNKNREYYNLKQYGK